MIFGMSQSKTADQWRYWKEVWQIYFAVNVCLEIVNVFYSSEFQRAVLYLKLKMFFF